MIRILFLLIFFYSLIHPNQAFAACDPALGECPAGVKQLEDVFGKVITVSVGLAFIAMFVVVVIAGTKYLTSGGEQKAISAAHSTVTWAIFGILFLAVAWILLQLVQVVTGVKVTDFNIRKLF